MSASYESNICMDKQHASGSHACTMQPSNLQTRGNPNMQKHVPNLQLWSRLILEVRLHVRGSSASILQRLTNTVRLPSSISLVLAPSLLQRLRFGGC